MPQTTKLGLRYPAVTDAPNVPLDVQELAEDVEAKLGLIICTSATRPASPYQGMQIYETDTTETLFWTGSAWVATARAGAWRTYAPSWTAATTNPTIGNGTITGRYVQFGKLVSFEVEIVGGSTTAWGTGSYSITAPVTPVGRRLQFTGSLRDSSASATYPLFGEFTSGASTTVFLRRLPATAGGNFGNVDSANPITLATGDSLTIAGTYEAA